MAQKIKIMLSSRCNDPLLKEDGSITNYTDARRLIKSQLEKEEILGHSLFEVWINEDAPSTPGDSDSWDTCLSQVDKCDVLIAIINGNPGWAKSKDQIGICHAELMAGLNKSPGKVSIVKASKIDSTNDKNEKFAKYVESQNLFRETFENQEQLIQVVKNAVVEAIKTLAKKGVREVSKGKYFAGDALAWSRMNYEKRASAIRETLLQSVSGDAAPIGKKDNVILAEISGSKLYYFIDAIPDSLSLSAAFEMVGRPQLMDYRSVSGFKKNAYGPLHLIGCHKNITSSQVIKVIGHSDVVLVEAPFGIYVADSVRKAQLVFIKECRDSTTTTHGVQRFEDWMLQSGEGNFIVERAKSRTKILNLLSKEAS